MANNTKLCCQTCNKSFSKMFSLKRHQKNVHHDPDVEFLVKKQIICPTCKKEVGITFKELQTHLGNEHQIEIKKEVIIFASKDDFFQWKAIEEKETKSSYVQHNSVAKAKCGHVTTHYYCHRSGSYKTKGTGKRQIKHLGSNKIDSLCPSQMKVKEIDDNRVELQYIRTHIGHEFDIRRLRLTDDEKIKLADKIAKHIPLDTILNDINLRNSGGTDVERIHVTSRRDLINISRQFGLHESGTNVANDCESVEKVEAVEAPQNTVDEVREIATPNENLVIAFDQSVFDEIGKRVKALGKENTETNVCQRFKRIYDEFLAELDDCRSVEDQQFACKILQETLATLRAAKKRKIENQTAPISVRLS